MESFQVYKSLLLLASILSVAQAQQVGTQQAEVHPPLTWQRCNSDGSCTTVQGEVVIDANWRWVHTVDGYTNCYTGNEWDSSICSSNEECAQQCAVDGADYSGTYGITTSGSSLRLNFVTQGSQTNVGSRVYLMDDEETYTMFDLLNKEFTFDVDASELPCGLNGAVYFVTMDADGGKSRYPGNAAGAKYGTGYCDSQCPRDLKFINGEANFEGWEPSPDNPNAGTGTHGSCCPEMDIWEANSISTAYTPHPCDDLEQIRCSGDTCGGTYSAERYAGTCDPDGCDFNPYRQGNHSYYGPGMVVDTNRPITVVTQFLTDDGTDTGTLAEIKRFYVQDGEVIANSESTFPANPGNSITPEFCDAQKALFGDIDVFNPHGGLAGMGASMELGMVLVLSLWDDYHSHMLWLDSTYPTDGDPSQPGIARGTCPTDSGAPEDVESQHADAYVVYSNIKFGPIGSTFGNDDGGSGPGPNPTTTSTTTTNPPTSVPTGQAQRWEQCGGNDWRGPTQCASPWTCTVINQWYHQCL
ncbi:glycoside hydrolase [Aspergillus egyptiacus]|nr:glycoside hydrolase [Aspergillus egyptiacus]